MGSILKRNLMKIFSRVIIYTPFFFSPGSMKTNSCKCKRSWKGQKTSLINTQRPWKMLRRNLRWPTRRLRMWVSPFSKFKNSPFHFMSCVSCVLLQQNKYCIDGYTKLPTIFLIFKPDKAHKDKGGLQTTVCVLSVWTLTLNCAKWWCCPCKPSLTFHSDRALLGHLTAVEGIQSLILSMMSLAPCWLCPEKCSLPY